jgi:N-acetylglutamate synthase-like GNAT family acetyltransferase
MVGRPIRIRRGRRTDFAAVMALLAGAGSAIAADRRALHRFRQLVADLGADFYLATIDERIAGVAHITYARQLASAPIATLATLVVGEESRRRGVGTALLRFALERARRRACGTLRCALNSSDGGARLLTRMGATVAGQLYEVAVGGAE